jgi:hypothetical protein
VNKRAWRPLVAGVALVALTAVGANAATAAGPASKGEPTVTAKFKGGKKDLRLNVPDRIRQGTTLRIVNDTKPSAVGPHTFTLVKRAEIPRGKEQQKKCENLETPFCNAVAFDWHLFEPPNTINQPLSDVGEEGWDRPGDRDTVGDSWFTGTRGEKFSAPVSSAPRTLHYICVVHPFLKGKIEVKPGATL